jgi:cellulose synthase (UDP-forming)
MQAVGNRLEGLPRGPAPLVQWTVLLFATLLALLIISVPLDFGAQCVFAIGCFVAALVLRKQSGRFPVLVLITLSLTVSMRYMYWRISSTLAFESWLDIVFGYGLLAAELYSLLVLTLGYLQTAWSLRRKPQMLTMPPSQWPTVDVFIPRTTNRWTSSRSPSSPRHRLAAGQAARARARRRPA